MAVGAALLALSGVDAAQAEPLAARAGAAAEAGAGAPRILMLEKSAGDARVRLLFLPGDAAAIERPSRPEVLRLTVTGAYSSGDRFGPEGFVLRRGEPVRPVPQGWDGLLLVEKDGRASVHDVSKAMLDGKRYDLRRRGERRAFLDEAEDRGLSAIQSHLLINEGRLDLKPVEGARRFRRRLLFQTADGRLGVFDTSPSAMTLYDAAVALQTAAPDVRMALNLDMGAYDFCVWRAPGQRTLCGLLRAPGQQALTNLIEFEVPARP